ncbi:MAG TPA: sugar phosphate nucleotidyltransferase [Pyrinomonadaceae bacterium]
MNRSNYEHRWAVILAGGDGTRLKPLTRALTGDDRPKQFCRIISDRTLLDHTQRRVALLLRPAQTLVVVTRTHERFYQEQLNDWRSDRLLVQPENKGTAPAILLSLLRIAQFSPKAVVAFFPSDHHFSDEAGFMAQVRRAFDLVERHPSHLTLLGVQPDRTEVEYGWIEPVRSVEQDDAALLPVRRFWEKPAYNIAERLMCGGSLWNTFVMIGHVEAFLGLISRALPNLFRTLSSVAKDLGSDTEAPTVKRLYSRIVSANFSKQVLALQPDKLSVLRVPNVGWTDLGAPQRVAATFKSRQLQNSYSLRAP